MVMQNVPDITENQKEFIDQLCISLEEINDNTVSRIREKYSTLSKSQASVAINYLLFRRAEQKTGWKVNEIV